MSQVLEQSEKCSPDPAVFDDLTPKQSDFAKHYVATKNGTESARLAGYSGSDSVLAVMAFDNLRNPKIIVAIEHLRADSEAEMSDKIMDAAEVKSHLSNLARTAERDSDKIRAAELMGKIHGIINTKFEVSSKDIEEALVRAARQFPAQVPLPPTFGKSEDEGPAS